MQLENLKIKIDDREITSADVASGRYMRVDPHYLIVALRSTSPANDYLARCAATKAKVDFDLSFDECFLRGLGRVTRLQGRGAIAPNAVLSTDEADVITWRLVVEGAARGQRWGAFGQEPPPATMAPEEVLATEEFQDALRAARSALASDHEHALAVKDEEIAALRGEIAKLEAELATPRAVP